MATGGTKGRVSGFALLVMLCLLTIGVAAPIFITFHSDRISVVSSDLSAAPRDSVRITSPTPIGTSQLITIEAGVLFAADASGRAIELPSGSGATHRSGGRLAINNSVFRIQTGQSVPSVEPALPLLEAISALQFDSILLRQATVHFAMPDGRIESVSHIDGEVTNKRKTLAIAGKGELRGQAVTFDLAMGVASDPRPGTTIPFKLAMKSAAMNLSFDGRAGFVGPAQLQGDVEFTAPNVRQVARWFGAPWPSGSGLRALTGKAQLQWAGPAMAFNRATFAMDGNEATGTLHLKFAELRPSIGGTLALSTLDLGHYFPAPTQVFSGAVTNAWATIMDTDLALPLTQHFDADLRLSADKVKFGTVQLGRAAMAVTVSQGRMLADIAAFEFEGARGGGQIIADMSGVVPKVTLRGRVEDVDASRATSALFGHAAFAGRMSITTDITATGKTGDQLLKSSSGRMNVAMRNGGRIGIDLRGLAESVRKRATEGWGYPARGQTGFDELDGTFQLRAGTLVIDSLRTRSGDSATVFSGTVDVAAARLNGTIVQLPVAPIDAGLVTKAASTVQVAPSSAFALQVFGPWGKPVVRNDNLKDSSGQETVKPPDRM